MKKTVSILLVLIAVLTLLVSCGKKTDHSDDPNAVLTDSDVPLDIGAAVGYMDPTAENAIDVEVVPLDDITQQ